MDIILIVKRLARKEGLNMKTISKMIVFMGAYVFIETLLIISALVLITIFIQGLWR